MSDTFNWPAKAFEPPFYEKERGGGEVTKRIKEIRRLAAKARLNEVSEEIRSIRATGEATLARRVLPELEAEREALREELGHLRLVRGAA